MVSGQHNSKLLESVKGAEHIIFFQSSKIECLLEKQDLFDNNAMQITNNINVLVEKLTSVLRGDDVLIFMSNGDFCGAKDLLIAQLKKLQV